MVVMAAQHHHGTESHSQSHPPGIPPVPGPRHAGPNPFRGPNPNHLERQQQGNWPFFYVQPSQPYVPCQWPMPMPYVPFGGFPGLGYGMVLPQFPTASYVDAPGYVLPHNQMHMVDYRRMMAPHQVPTMAYQSRRFRYQHTTPSGRVMVSSEVQTEPICANSPRQGCSVVTSTQSSSESGRSTDSSSVLSSIPHEDQAARTVLPSDRTGDSARMPMQNGGILFQAEEVRIECHGSPTAVKITHSKETAELASNADGELLHCNVGSAEDVVLGCFQPVSFEDELMKERKDLSHLEDPCPDILMVSCPSNGSASTLEGSIVAPAEPVNSTLVVQGDPSLVNGSQDICGNPKNIHFKILHLPVDLQHMEDLQQMEASIWSVESLMPYMPTAEWMMQNNLMTPRKPSLATVMEVPAETNQPTSSPSDAPLGSGAVIELGCKDSLTSLEFLQPFLPSSSNSYYNRQSANVQKVGNSGDLAKKQPEAKVQCEPPSPNAVPQKLKEEMTNRSVAIPTLGLEDQENCAATLFPVVPLKHKVRMCKSCSLKRNADVCPASPSCKGGTMKRHKVSRSRLTGDKVKVPLCATCIHSPENKAAVPANVEMNVTTSDVAEVSENVYQSRRCSKSLYSIRKAHSEKCPMSHQAKLREQNCSCDEIKAPRSTLAWSKDGCGRPNELMWERKEEHLPTAEGLTESERRFSGERSWRGSLHGSDSDSIKSGGKLKTHNKQKRASLEVHRKDTRY